LPGVPLRLLWPAGRYWLVEAREKRALFLQNVLAACPLPGTGVWRGRAENFMNSGAAEGRRPADLLISRAFLPWPQLLELARGKLAPGGLVVCLTLEEPPAELPADLAAHWRLLRAHRYSPSRQRPEQIRQFWAFEQARTHGRAN
jgi:16S rRNA (guanine527-N7)-methyltransferase